MTNQKGLSQILSLGLILAVVILGLSLGYAFYLKLGEEYSNTSYKIAVNKNVNVSENANTSTDETVNWKTYTNDVFGIKFKYPSRTQVNFYPDVLLVGMIRVVSEANPNKDGKLYFGGVGPGSIGITSYVFQSDLKAFAEETFNGKLKAEPVEVAGVPGYRIQGVLPAKDNRVVGSLEAKTDIYYVNYNAATWGFEFDAKTEFADQTPSHDDFQNLLSTVEFTVPDKTKL